MSKITLRVYNHEIESLIDQNHLDDAVAHCQHILKTFPKHLETYRLLGKSYLELHRYADAADIFQRVLMVAPDDFVAHLGMSIACDEQKDLDGALWHMERTFESNPSNGGVQTELRRLYGRRDGLEPPKIRLTRGALAQMYAKGGQYPQAIAEIKAVLAEDDSRVDMKTLLARVYWRAGQKVDAIELCSDLLRQYPYSLDANRILAEILPGTSLEQSVDLYKKRVQALDPYTAFASPSLFDTNSVPDTAVTLEKLETDDSPTWKQAAPASVDSKEDQPLPDFLAQAGWGPSTGEFKEGPVDFSAPDEPATSQLAAAEIPDWLKAMAPSSLGKDSPPAQADVPAKEDLDWLTGMGMAATTAATDAPDWLNQMGEQPNVPAAEEPVAPAQPADVPDWLNGLTPAAEEPVTPAQPADVPDWMSGLTPAAEEPVTPAQPADVPDWLNGLTPAAEEPVTPAQTQPRQPVALQAALENDQPASELSAPVTSGPGVGADDQDAAFKWLESLAAGQGAKAEELLTHPDERLDQAPGWVGQMDANPPAPVATAPAPYQPEKPIEPEENILGELSAPVTSGPGVGADDQDAAFKWLESLAAGQGAKAEELLTHPDERLDQAPGWVGAVSNPPTPLSASVTSGPGVGADDQDEAFKWLESLAAGQGAKAEELLTHPDKRLDQVPDWVGDVPYPADEPVADGGVLQEPLPAEPENASWLDELPEEATSQQPAPTQAGDDWLTNLASATGLPQPPAPVETESPEWVNELGEATSGPDREDQESAPAAQIVAANEDVPDWLKTMDNPAQGTGLIVEDFPDWLKDESADERPPKQEPVSEWIPASESLPVLPTEATPAQLDSSLGVTHPLKDSASAEPPAADEFALPAEFSEPDQASKDWFTESQPPAEPVPAPKVEMQPVEKRPVVPPPPARVTLHQTGSLSLDKDSQALQRARTLIDKGGLDAAMSEYSKLVRRGKLTEEVIYDLQDATYRHPVDVIVWQTLGDAYMRSSRLQDALDAYTKAEELLR
ncbi:tetratricopeptide repeat protein [bacterium]|nr:tetratricopeptide repeat protein [bacterium]